MTDFAERRRVMVDTQIRPSDVTKFPVIDAMLSVPRENFVPDVMRAAAYAEEMIELEPGRVIVEPRTLGKLLDMVDIQPTESMLLVGGGLGYSAAVAAHLAQLVVAVEDAWDCGLFHWRPADPAHRFPTKIQQSRARLRRSVRGAHHSWLFLAKRS